MKKMVLYFLALFYDYLVTQQQLILTLIVCVFIEDTVCIRSRMSSVCEQNELLVPTLPATALPQDNMIRYDQVC